MKTRTGNLFKRNGIYYVRWRVNKIIGVRYLICQTGVSTWLAYPLYVVFRGFSPTDVQGHLAIGCRLDLHGILEQAIEQLAPVLGCPTVES